ncbi:tRNA (carboxymethyluridine(34)-5-O)-methyltransferase alkbh8-like [Saccoglossus kowalevskii]|uniref:tRNA (carboxymethyluridine(34)-5-O)-methyltransferase n=1 Tax=Saccoglossus kowalevskii TaxID=10224 RepID=A0ABM0MPZ2_SACKO|nr:PREDICTED: alkylated DNA repair protein alkB homolog 8-like [Saccoglossus kowalevskii]
MAGLNPVQLARFLNAITFVKTFVVQWTVRWELKDCKFKSRTGHFYKTRYVFSSPAHGITRLLWCYFVLQADHPADSQVKKYKQLKALHGVDGKPCSTESTNIVNTFSQSLLVANGGLGNGVQREELQQLFFVHGKVTSIAMPPRKPYAFVCFQEIKDAETAIALINGTVLTRPTEMSTENITLYLSFLKEVPKENLQSNDNLPPGLVLVKDFIDAEMEDMLLRNIDWNEEMLSEAGNVAPKTLKHRQVKHYGYEFRYDNNNVDKDKPLHDGIPAALRKIIDDIMATQNIQHGPNQITVNQYQPGQGIPPHIDTHSAFEGEIISLSLGSNVIMDFKHPNGQHIPVLVPQRSLLVMTGESRYLWTHGITPRKHDVAPADTDTGLTLTKRTLRTSFTFRAIRHAPCDCDFPAQCDSQQKEMKEKERLLPKSDDQASALEAEHVHKVYETIATHFSDTRHSQWPKVTKFINQLPNGSIFADIGCGNGKYLGINTSIFQIGCDRSSNLVEICRQRDYEAFTCDALSVPIRDNSCDAVISIAVIHHLSTQNRIKSKYLKESKHEMSGDLGENLHHRKLTAHGDDPVAVVAKNSIGNKTKEGHDACLCKSIEPDECCIGGGENSSSCQKNSKDDSQIQNDTQSAKDNEQTNRARRAEPIKDSIYSSNTLSVHVNRTAFAKQDLLVPWHLKSKNGKRNNIGEENASSKDQSVAENVCTKTVFHRFYHVYKEGELESLCQECSGVRIVEGYYDEGNWCVIIKKE